ncbi:uncharacterized protein LOC133800151 [Humulus lupulus]|uniref:uncharacterized protein LOC133800151 n=1 Tax=Humulus lupulus TaxID=3486 RepID=UPI002B40CA88|nr:uncharacterized protein LOC133800151 [Humulus lupulus]
MDEPEVDSIVEARKELMIPSNGNDPILKTAHFLKPTVTSIKDPSFKVLHRRDTLRHSSITNSKWGSLPFEVAFNGWLFPQENWKTWVERLSFQHRTIWEKAGIFDAIMGSTYKINKYPEVVLELAKNWCPATNTFLFLWAEATVTLEDMALCGGYSVLGCPVFSPPETFLTLLESSRMTETEEKLNEARLEIVRSKAKKACQLAWMRRFMEEENDLEHVAFLSLWLSRFVFPGPSRTTILKHLFPLAIRLAKGTRVALAPAVLATIYRDFTLLKRKMVGSSEPEGELTLWAPFQLVLVWVWERFLMFKPKRNVVQVGEPRLAQWHKVKKSEQPAFDSAGGSFSWRPYATTMDSNCALSQFYREKAEWLLVDSDSNEQLVSLVKCLRPTELVGVASTGVYCIEQYLPHRVARQFGMDQDLPGNVVRFNKTTHTTAWKEYNKPIGSVNLYIPSKFFNPDVTLRYFKWWDDLSKLGDGEDEVKKSVGRQSEWREENHLSCPPGFPPKSGNVKSREPYSEDQVTLKEMFKTVDIDENATNGGEIPRDDDPLLVTKKMGQVEEIMPRPIATVVEVTALEENKKTGEEIVMEKGEINARSGFDLDQAKALEDRVSKLENMIDEIKKERANKFCGKG